MLFMTNGRLRPEGLEDARTGNAPAEPGVECLAEYVVPGSLRFLGIYRARDLTALSRFLRGRPSLDIAAVEPILHLQNMLILERAEGAPPPEEFSF
jgi:hypothetical protein